MASHAPLGIPTIADRALQAMVKHALEPCWEAQFEASSYGFRPGRSAHDAIGRVWQYARATTRKHWGVDADIEGAFDHIDHAYLLRTIGNFPARERVHQWLKAGYVDKGVFRPTEAGTPQGGGISPLLANIALHDMEQALGVKRGSQGENRSPRAVARYSDGFVVFCETEEDAKVIKDTILPRWLGERGLNLSRSKTRVVHLSEGFDFLGFNSRRYRDASRPTSWMLHITPSKKSVNSIRRRLKAEWRALRGQGIQEVIRRLNPIIRGQANYSCKVRATKSFHALDHDMWLREERYVRRTHRNKSATWQRRQYWAGSTNSGKITGCLATNRRGNICSSTPGSGSSTTCSSKGQPPPMTRHYVTISPSERKRPHRLCSAVG
jgi:RNA-directed DNA polymerase